MLLYVQDRDVLYSSPTRIHPFHQCSVSSIFSMHTHWLSKSYWDLWFYPKIPSTIPMSNAVLGCCTFSWCVCPNRSALMYMSARITVFRSGCVMERCVRSIAWGSEDVRVECSERRDWHVISTSFLSRRHETKRAPNLPVCAALTFTIPFSRLASIT